MNNNLSHQTVPILDFSAQYVQLIARRVREVGVYSVLVPPSISLEELRKLNPIGLIPFRWLRLRLLKNDAPKCDPRIFELGVPILRHLLRHAGRRTTPRRRRQTRRSPP